MSNQNNSQHDNQDLPKSGEPCTTSNSPIDNINGEEQNIVENKIANSRCVENRMNEDQIGQPDFTDSPNEDVYKIDAGLDLDVNSSLSEEEVEKKFQELRLAFRTDAMTLQKRLIMRKRLRDQYEINVEKEINLMRSQLNNLRYLCSDSESLEQLANLKKHLDVILASANHLSGCAEAFGFVQNEEKMSAAVAIILRKIKAIERTQSEMSKSSDSDKPDGKRIQLLPILDDENPEERTVWRRSAASIALNSTAKRRASIASVPRNSLQSDDITDNLCPSFFLTRTSNKKFSPIQCSSPKAISPLVGSEQIHVRSRKENKTGDHGLKYVQDYDSGHSMEERNDRSLVSSDEDAAAEDKENGQLAVFRMTTSLVHRKRTNSVASETLNIIDSLRNVIKWNIFLIRNSRFQFPANVHQYVPFLITWYAILLIVAIFTSGFLTGFNRCFNLEAVYSLSLAACAATFWIAVLNVLFMWKPLKYVMLTLAIIFAVRLQQILHDEGIDGVIEKLGIRIESHYISGAPV